MATSPEEVLRSLTPPPKNLVGKQVVTLLVSTWVAECSGKCAVAQLTQDETNAVFWAWIKKGKYNELVQAHMLKKLLKRPRAKQTEEASQEKRARNVLNAAAKLHGKLAVIAGGKIVEKGKEAGDSKEILSEVWKQAGLKPRSVINEMAEDIQRQLLLENRAETDESNGDAITAAAE